MATKFDVDVTDPRTDGPRFNTFVTYNLLSTWHTSGVRRRYSDFEWLREVLKYRFHGTWVAGGDDVHGMAHATSARHRRCRCVTAIVDIIHAAVYMALRGGNVAAVAVLGPTGVPCVVCGGNNLRVVRG